MVVAGAFVMGGAHLAMSQEEEQQGRRPRRQGMRGPGMQGRAGGDFMQWRMMRQLDLTENQQTQIQLRDRPPRCPG